MLISIFVISLTRLLDTCAPRSGGGRRDERRGDERRGDERRGDERCNGGSGTATHPTRFGRRHPELAGWGDTPPADELLARHVDGRRPAGKSVAPPPGGSSRLGCCECN